MFVSLARLLMSKVEHIFLVNIADEGFSIPTITATVFVVATSGLWYHEICVCVCCLSEEVSK